MIETKRYVSNAIQVTRSNGTSQVSYLYKDHLGSVDAVTNQNGQTITRMYFAPFGQKAQISTGQWSTTAQNNTVYTLSNLHDITNKGYTGHEHIDAFDLVHMGGRIYDPITGRFIQADPFVQEAKNSQNLNRYTYVLNNPMGYTDPSGYFFKQLNRALGPIAPFIGAIVMFAAPPGSSLFIGGNGIFFGFMAAGIGAGNFKGAAFGAFSAAAFTSIGGAFSGVEGSAWAMGGPAHVLSHAMTGGLLSIIQGGHFGHGFISAGLTKAADVNSIIGVSQATGMDALRIITAALIGGTISDLTGGKFANGALTAALGQAFNGNSVARRSNAQQQQQAMIDLTVNNLISQIRAIKPNFRYTTVRPNSGPNSRYTQRDISTLQNILHSSYIPMRVSSPIPESFMRYEIHIDMRNVPTKSSGITAEGYPRNNRWFFRQLRKQHPQFFNRENWQRITKGQNPIVNTQWVKHFPHHASFMGSRIDHHHMLRGPFATPLPESVHVGYSTFLHFQHLD